MVEIMPCHAIQDGQALSSSAPCPPPLPQPLPCPPPTCTPLQTRALEQLTLQLASLPERQAAALIADARWADLSPHTLRLVVNTLASGLRATAREATAAAGAGAGGGGGWVGRQRRAAPAAAVKLGPRTLLLGEVPAARAQQGAHGQAGVSAKASEEEQERLRREVGVRVPVVRLRATQG